MSFEDIVHARRNVEASHRRMWSAVSVTLDEGAGPDEVAEFLGMHRNTMYRHLKRWGPPDRKGDGRRRFWTDGARFHRGVRAS